MLIIKVYMTNILHGLKSKVRNHKVKQDMNGMLRRKS